MAPYDPPTDKSYTALDVSGYDHNMLLCLIGKGGKGFYGITRRLNIDYLWYDQYKRRIELWGDEHILDMGKSVHKLHRIVESFSKKYVPRQVNDEIPS